MIQTTHRLSEAEASQIKHALLAAAEKGCPGAHGAADPERLARGLIAAFRACSTEPEGPVSFSAPESIAALMRCGASALVKFSMGVPAVAGVVEGLRSCHGAEHPPLQRCWRNSAALRAYSIAVARITLASIAATAARAHSL